MIAMSNNKMQLESLLSNIQEGLKKYSIKELNEGIISFLIKKSDKSMEINYVLEITSQEFVISKSILKSKNLRGIRNEAKQIAFCLLVNNLGLSYRYIGKNIFFCNHSSVGLAIKKMNQADPNHAIDKNFIEKYKKLENKLLANFTNNKII